MEITEIRQICRELAEDVEDSINCPICLENSMEIVQCVIGHHICVKCQKSFTKCPTCQGSFEGTKCFVIQDLIDTMNKFKITIDAFENNPPVTSKVKNYRKVIKTLFDKMSTFLNMQSDSMIFLNEHLKKSNTVNNEELQRQISALTKELDSIKDFMDTMKETLIDLKK